MENAEKKKRKTLDEYLGIKEGNTTIILIVAILSSIITGGILAIVSPISGLYGGYYLFKQRKNPNISGTTKKMRVVLFILCCSCMDFFKA